MVKNPVMFTVEVVTFAMFFVSIYSIFNAHQGSFAYNIIVFIILFLTLLFANFAEAIAEARVKAQADSLKKTRSETPAKLVVGDKLEIISSSELKKGDVFECEAGDTIPSDGEIVEGLASIDESAITGESAPVIRESGGDKSSVTGGTKVLSDSIRDCMYDVGAFSRLYRNGYYHCVTDFSVRLFDTNHYRKPVVCYRNCRNGPCIAGQRNNQIG